MSAKCSKNLTGVVHSAFKKLSCPFFHTPDFYYVLISLKKISNLASLGIKFTPYVLPLKMMYNFF